MDKIISFLHNGKEYQVEITYKRLKYAHFRFRDNKFIVTAPRNFTLKRINECLEKFSDDLIKKAEERQKRENSGIHVLGIEISQNEDGSFEYNDKLYKNFDEFVNVYKKSFLKLITERVEYYRHIMNVPPYKIRIKKMKSRYGSNSRRTMSLSFATCLMEYSIPIIDSVVVHELAHHFEFNHSNRFYNVVYKYCPQYDYFDKCLRKRIYHD